VVRKARRPLTLSRCKGKKIARQENLLPVINLDLIKGENLRRSWAK
jgi:hypothetical protein